MAQRALTPGNAAYCSECGAETQPDAQACARCEQPFTGSMQAVFCPICNSINPVEAAECVNCNAKFPEPGTIGTSAPLSPADGSPEEEYLRRILQLSREKAKARGAEGGTEPASFLESGGSDGDMEESLWKLAEPFDRMLERRKRRLEQMDALIDRARGRIKGLESSTNPLEIRERDELKRQIEELLLEKEDILKLEEGLVNMENTYRNILRLQREELLRDKGRLLDERHHALSGAEVDLERKRWELEQKASGGRPATKEESTITVRSDSEIGELKSRMVQLEEQMERLMDERNKLVEQQKELLRLRDELKVVMKDVDDLLGDLPPDKIRTFAKSKKFALYEKILERLEL